MPPSSSKAIPTAKASKCAMSSSPQKSPPAASSPASLVMGEFGRTPKVNKDAGRDHWPHAMSILAAGAGIPRGQVIGATDPKGYYANQNVHSPEDLAASLYTKMGIDPTEHLHTNT